MVIVPSQTHLHYRIGSGLNGVTDGSLGRGESPIGFSPSVCREAPAGRNQRRARSFRRMYLESPKWRDRFFSLPSKAWTWQSRANQQNTIGHKTNSISGRSAGKHQVKVTIIIFRRLGSHASTTLDVRLVSRTVTYHPMLTTASYPLYS